MAGVDPYAFTNAFSSTVQGLQQQRDARQINALRAQQIDSQNALAAVRNDPAATPEQYVRAGDVAGGNALSNMQAQQEELRARALPSAGILATRVLGIQDPVAKRAAFRQAVDVNRQVFELLGTPHDQALAKIDGSSDAEIDQTLQALAQFAPQEKPAEVAAGGTLIQRQPDGSYKQVYAAPGRVSYEDTGGEKVPVDSVTGVPRTDLQPLKKTPTPYQTQQVSAPESMLSADGIELAAQNYRLTGKLPTGLGRGAAAINAKIMTRAAQQAAESGDDAQAAVINRYAFQARQKAQAETLKQFTSGKNGNTVRSLNVAVQHLDQLQKLGDALNNGDVQVVNKLGNAWAKQTGSAAPNSFEAMKKVVADELVKAIVGSGGGVADREEMAATVSSAQSPAQLNDVIANFKGLMAGQLNGLRQQYQEGTGRNDFERYLLPITKSELEAHDAGHASPAGAPVRVSTPQEAMALPPNTRFMTPDGRVKVRP